MKTGKAILSVLVALTAGAALGILFAPEKKVVIYQEDQEEPVMDLIDKKFRELTEAINKMSRKTESANGSLASRIANLLR